MTSSKVYTRANKGMDGMWGFRLWDFVLLSSLLVDLLSVGQILRLLCICIIITLLTNTGQVGESCHW